MAGVRSERRGGRVGIAPHRLGGRLIVDSTSALTCSQHSVLLISEVRVATLPIGTSGPPNSWEWNGGGKRGTYASEQYKKVLFAGKNCFSQVMLHGSSAASSVASANMHPTHWGYITRS